jgi:Effector Associated Constant Component 1
VQALVTFEAANAQAELESLRDWLTDTVELRGWVSEVPAPPPSEALGPLLDALAVTLGPGGAATAFAAALIAWIRQCRGSVRIRIDLPGGRRVRLDAEHVKGLTGQELRTELDMLVRALAGDGGADGDGAAGRP